ncbi:tyrosine-type recombinase/integrase [Trichocoleus sp. Lan]|uniref:tyrosine-type recombinase/integrase n=1 Tax=Trichocoleus sp. Lan TaxID=2933927 RepID=UPI003298CC4C
MESQPEVIQPLVVLQSIGTEQSVTKPPLLCTHCGGNRYVKRRKDKKNGHQIYLCKQCGRHFIDNPNKFKAVVNPQAEYEKNIWDCRNLGLEPKVGTTQYKLSFDVVQPWLLPPLKQYIKLTLATLSWSSGSEKLCAVKRFSKYLAEIYPDIVPSDIDRAVIISFLGHLASTNLSANTKASTIGCIRGFLEFCYQNKYLDVRRYLIRHEDFPKRPKSQPRYIPEEVMQQLNQHLPKLPEPVMRMVLVLQECGMRISELLLMKADCLLQDKAGDWFLRYYQFKMKKEITIPLSRELVRVIQEQQRYITDNVVKFDYLFCANEGGARSAGGVFVPSRRNMTAQAFSRYLNKLAEQQNIVDAQGKRWHFQSHQFRHTVGTRMINNGVPQHIIQRYLGHESPNMTAVYAQIHDQTMKEAIAKFQGKVVNIAGQVIESHTPEVETLDLEWFKRSIQAQALPNGSCALPTISQGCPHANACLTCAHFRTTTEFLESHKAQLAETEKLIEKAKGNNWIRQIEMNEKVKANLVNIINSLEVSNEAEA